MTQDRKPAGSASLDALLSTRDRAAEEASVRYLTGPDKEAWSQTDVAFMVREVSIGEGGFGQRWEMVVRAMGDDEDRIMTIGRNRARDPLMKELQRLCRTSEQGPLQLDVVEKQDGTTFQWFKRPGVTSVKADEKARLL